MQKKVSLSRFAPVISRFHYFSNSLADESFEFGLLEYPQYTRPRVWRDRAVPEVLISGHHNRIREWRLAQSENITKARRQDLWERYEQTRRARAEP